MPPKKDGKKEAVSRPDNSGIPKQDVEFKFNINVKTEETQLPFALMIQWFGVTSDKIERIDTAIIDSWSKIEGGFSFEKVCDLIRVDDDFCKTLCNKKFFIYFVNDESKVEDVLELDYSQLLMARGEGVEPVFTFKSQTIKVMGIDEVQINLSGDKQLLQETYRHFLNPFEVEVIGAKDVPLDTQSKYQPAYLRYMFFDGSIGETHGVVGQGKLVWNHKHVFLAGLMDAAILKEKLRSKYLKFELHDRDQIQNKKIKEDIPLFDLTRAIQIEMENQKPPEDDPKKKGGKKQPEKKEAKKDVKKDAKKKDVKLGDPILPPKTQTLQNNYGIAAFFLIDFLKPAMKTARYKAPVVPKTTFEDYQSKNIDLNTTARNQMQKVISSNNYFEQDTAIVVGFTLSYAIGSFKKPVASEQPVVEDPKKKKQASPKQVEKPVQQEKQKLPKDVFERVIYVLPYKSPDYVEKIQSVFYGINLNTFNLKSRREITTHLLSTEDKMSTEKDFITGIQLIDNESRVYIFQGLRNGSMQKFHEIMVKSSPNTKQFKILKNSDISFLGRIFTDFNIQIKRIRFRPSLTKLLLDPSIYIKSKVPEDISRNLNKINQIKRICDDLKTVDSMNLWPDQKVLVQIQRKFSDSLSYEDINGYEEIQKKKKNNLSATANDAAAKTINFMTSQQLKHVTMDEFSLPKITTSQQQMTQSMPNVGNNTTIKRNVQTKTFMKDDAKIMKTYDMRLKKAEIDANQPVFIYAGQKNNWYEKKMRQMREKIKQDGKGIYTYSKDYLGLSIDPRVEEEQGRIQRDYNATKNISADKFSSLIIKTKEQRMKLAKKPGNQDIEDLKRFPYHEQKVLQKQLKKNTRDMPINSEKAEFQKYIKKPQYFSVPEVKEGQKISPVERFKMQQEAKKKIDEENRNKMMGDPIIKIKKGYITDKSYGVDRFKDIREGEAVKKGFIDINKKKKQKRPVQDYEVSYMLNETKDDPSFNPLIRRDDNSKNVGMDEFNFYQRPQVLTLSSVAKPLHKTNF